MSEAFPGFSPRGEADPERTVHVDPTLGIEEVRLRWEARAAQWRACELAELVFGGEVSTRLIGLGTRAAFRGLLHLDVPFTDITRHRALEAVFLAAAAGDPVVSRVPFVFVLGPAGT